MKRKEAAEFLGVSIRTLDRIAASGRLSKGTAPGKTRSFVVFQREELEVIKAELSAGRQVVWTRPAAESASRDTIAFRLDPTYVNQLVRLASEQRISSGAFARRLVIRALESEAFDFEIELRRVRESLAAIFFALLTMKLGASPAEARKIIADTILSGDSKRA